MTGELSEAVSTLLNALAKLCDAATKQMEEEM